MTSTTIEPGLIEYPDVEQRSDEWYAQRCGLVTASAVGALITSKTLKLAANDTSRGLTAALVAERITGRVEPTYTSDDMWRGIEEESRARDMYVAHNGVSVREIGFMTRDLAPGVRLGYSPDGLVGDDGLIEVKAPRQKGQLVTVLSGEIPPQHMAQVQAGLLVSGRKWLDFISWHGGMHMWTVRVLPDPKWQTAITEAVTRFEEVATDITDKYLKAVEGLPMTERMDLEIVI